MGKLLLYIFSFVIPIIGIIVGIVWMNEHEIDKMKTGKNHLILGIASIVFTCIGMYAFSDIVGNLF